MEKTTLEDIGDIDIGRYWWYSYWKILLILILYDIGDIDIGDIGDVDIGDIGDIDIGDIDFTCVLPPDFNFLTKRQN